jgi:serine/threonine protein kinase
MVDRGARIGGYAVLGPLGRGGMGEVYRARDTRLQREVAIKILPEHFAHDPTRLARFEREARRHDGRFDHALPHARPRTHEEAVRYAATSPAASAGDRTTSRRMGGS